jgi:hypothetical protein
MTPETAQALHIELKPDGRGAMVMLYRGSAFAFIERSSRDRFTWRGVTVSGELFKAKTVAALVDILADNLPPS